MPQNGSSITKRRCRCSYRCQKVVEALSKEGLFSTRIGIHTAQVFVGNFGARDRMNYTLAGDGVNLASRLEGANRFYGTRILVSGYTVSKLQSGWLLRHVDTVSVKGKDESTAIYEVLAHVDEITPLLVDVVQVYERGLKKYRTPLSMKRLNSFKKCCVGLMMGQPRSF